LSIRASFSSLGFTFAIVSLVAITGIVRGTLSFRMHPQIYYAIGTIWTLLIALLTVRLFRNDIERQGGSSMSDFADLSAVLASELRKVTADILSSKTRPDVEQNTARGFRSVLNLAHEYYSKMTNEYCTACVAAIVHSDGERVCRITQYDDFVPDARRDREIEIPVSKGLFGFIIEKNIRALVIDDYTSSQYPIYPVPIIEEGFCTSGICTPIKVLDKTTAFLNVDSPKRNAFKPNEHEIISITFAELLGQLMQIAEFRLKEIEDEQQ
jgi:hypothetical protein